ncbi:hypothetical protein K443DRAFT_686960, partial [Laccaria amethystina LaAM-08-1]
MAPINLYSTPIQIPPLHPEKEAEPHHVRAKTAQCYPRRICAAHRAPAPAGSTPGLGVPTRGGPKVSGSRGKGQSKAKSGVLFWAVEYC